MMISGADTSRPQSPVNQPQNGDNVSKSLQSRIESLQKQLQQLSENEDIDPKEKMKKKEEINRQISELNEQLNQYKQQKEQEKAQPSSYEKRFDRYEPSDSAESMSRAISADVSVKQAQTRGSAARTLTGKANVIESEIRQDGARGVSTEKKQAELSKLRSRAEKATAAQAEELSKAEKKTEKNSKFAAGLDYLQALKDKIPGTEFFIGTVSYGDTYGNSRDNNFVVHPKYLEKLADDPEARKSFEESVTALNNFSNQFRASQAAQGREVVSEGWFCDEDGNWGGWSVTRKTDQRSHLQEMREEADKIAEKKAERREEQKKAEEKREEKKEILVQLKEKLGDKLLDFREYDESEISAQKGNNA